MKENEDLIVDDILDELNTKKKKKLNSGGKGKRTERSLVHLLNERFKDILSKNPAYGGFSRSVSSGARWGQKVNLSKYAEQVFGGDITCPDNFKFIFESKGGYNDIDLNSAFFNGHKQIDEFIKQVTFDADRTGRKPMLVWKKDRKPCLCFLKITDVPNHDTFQYRMYYREWIILNLDDVLKFNDDYFFK